MAPDRWRRSTEGGGSGGGMLNSREDRSMRAVGELIDLDMLEGDGVSPHSCWVAVIVVVVVVDGWSGNFSNRLSVASAAGCRSAARATGIVPPLQRHSLLQL